MLTREKILKNAPDALNKANQPWEVTIEGNSIVARWKWMDATFFAPTEINDKTKEFTFTVTLDDKGKWKEIDKSEEKTKNIGMNDGKVGFGLSSSSFKGKTTQKSFEFGLGKDNKTGDVGLVGFKFDTAIIKQPIRDYLTECGWKKAGLFGLF